MPGELRRQKSDGAYVHVLSPFAASASGGRSGAFFSALVLSLFFVLYGSISLFADSIAAHCEDLGPPFNLTWEDSTKRTYKATQRESTNPLFKDDYAFRSLRRAALLGLTLREADFARRITAAVLLGSLIGLERRAPNRAAGVRTMALVSLGACVFTIASAFNFEDGSQEWDASRISAALPSGVGFLGGAVIFKHGGGSEQKPELVGLTTACGIWLSCAIGTCCGGAMYFPAVFGTACMVATLRFGPRRPTTEEDDKPQMDGASDLGDELWRPPSKRSLPETESLAQPLVQTRQSSRQVSPEATVAAEGLSLSCDE